MGRQPPNLAETHYENFPIGWFLPRRERKHAYALYAFARTADDFADEPAFEGRRLELLDGWEDCLDRAAQGNPDLRQPVFIALAETFREKKLPVEPFKDLLKAFRLDVTKKVYKNYAELEEYCRFSANPVGRLALMIFGYNQPELFEKSDKICTGIQLVNHWQDIAIDLGKERVYLPEEDMNQFGYSYEDLHAQKLNDAFKSLMKFQLSRTRSLFREGRPLLDSLNRRLRWQVSLMCSGPLQILNRIEEVDFDIFRHRPSLSKLDLAKLFLIDLFRQR